MHHALPAVSDGNRHDLHALKMPARRHAQALNRLLGGKRAVAVRRKKHLDALAHRPAAAMLFRHGQAVERAVAAAQRAVLLHFTIERIILPLKKPVVFNERMGMRKVHPNRRIRAELRINAAHGGKRTAHDDGKEHILRRVGERILPAIDQKPLELRKRQDGENLLKGLPCMFPFGSGSKKIEPKAEAEAFELHRAISLSFQEFINILL